MKHLLSLIVASCVLAGVSVGCGKSAPEVPEVPDEPAKVTVTSVSVTPSSLELVSGKKASLTADVLPADATDKTVSWASSNAAVASVSGSGEVTAVAAGKASITVTTNDGGKQAVCTVTVTPAHVNVTSVTIDPTSLSVEKGQTGQLTVTVLPADASDPSVVWSSGDESVATVSQDGLVTGLSVGQTVITVVSKEDGTKKAECSVEVLKPSNMIWYKTYQDQLLEPYAFDGTGRPVSNSFVDGWGELVFESSVLKLGDKAFFNRTSLMEMILPARVASIGKEAFSGCSSLRSISLPEGLVSLGESAFYNCYALSRVTLPVSLVSFGDGVFSRCGALQAFESPLASSDGRCLLVEGTLVAFAPNGLTEYTIPSGTKAIGPSVMKYCTRLESVTIPASVLSIGTYAFYNCTSLRSLVFKGSTPPELGGSAFLRLDGSFTIYVPSSSVSAYKKADGWKEYASRIVAAD